ncbi:interferon-induced protein 44-like isoform X2 [Mercenaria mercenaria]|uniref:interferon-induced protein 44-like isoform X2 n=1 Tax=Mercenaria mercenaria TaxID=6596 RepID=UPI00234F0D9E|nr:interferon-induced protein 44-like isoform X2 [Mercenaria mercenaria]
MSLNLFFVFCFLSRTSEILKMSEYRMPLFGKEKKIPSTAAKKVQGAPVCKPDPWREFEENGSWTNDYKESLLQEIKNWKTKEDSVQNIRILLLGPIKAGKSAFLNTVTSIDKERNAEVAPAGGAQRSFTKTLQVFRPDGKLGNFRLLDTMGVEEGDLCGLNEDDILYIVNGNIDQNYEKEPRKKDKVQCVVFMMDANAVGQNNITDAARRKIYSLQSKLESKRIPRLLLLTKIDVLCEKVEKDITEVYTSAKVQNAVEMAAELFHLPVRNIFPVKNYTSEVGLKPTQDILPLLALREMIRFGTDYLNEMSVNTSDSEDSAMES